MKNAMLASERLLEIEEKFGENVERIVPLELDGETLRKDQRPPFKRALLRIEIIRVISLPCEMFIL